MRQSIICGIDIGNAAVKTAIGQFNPELSRPQIIGLASAPSNGMRRGLVSDLAEVTADIGQSVGRAQSMAGVTVSRAYVAINGLHLRSQWSHGVIAVSRADNEISPYDIERVIDAAAAVSLPPNRELIHVIPRNFIIDGQEQVKNALGMKGVRLEADVLLIDGLSPYIRHLAKCVNANDIEVAEFVFAPLATAQATLDKHQREHGVLNLDLGGGVSTLALFHEGELVHSAVLPIGARHVTNDLAIAFRTAMDKAETIKCLHGSTGEDGLAKGNVDLSELLGEADCVVPKKQIAKIIDARIGELFDLIIGEMKKAPRGQLLPAGVVLAGGGAQLAGLPQLTKQRLKLAVKVGRADGEAMLAGRPDQADDPSFATALGLVLWGFSKELPGRGDNLLRAISAGGLGKVGRWFKNFLP